MKYDFEKKIIKEALGKLDSFFLLNDNEKKVECVLSARKIIRELSIYFYEKEEINSLVDEKTKDNNIFGNCSQCDEREQLKKTYMVNYYVKNVLS